MLSIGIWSFRWGSLLYFEQVNSYKWDQKILLGEASGIVSRFWSLFHHGSFPCCQTKTQYLWESVSMWTSTLHKLFQHTMRQRQACTWIQCYHWYQYVYIFACQHIRSKVYYGSAATYCASEQRVFSNATVRFRSAERRRRDTLLHRWMDVWTRISRHVRRAHWRKSCACSNKRGIFTAATPMSHWDYWDYTWVEVMSFKRYEVTLPPITVGLQNRDCISRPLTTNLPAGKIPLRPAMALMHERMPRLEQNLGRKASTMNLALSRQCCRWGRIQNYRFLCGEPWQP